MRRLPSVKQLEAFLVIEATRNLTEAANRLHVSQPALSRTLQLMEETVQVRLFERNTRSMALTAAGAAMLPIAKRLVGEFRESFGRFGEFLGGQSGQVVVAGLPSIVVAMMPRATQQLANASPGVEVKVLALVEQEVLAAVRSGSVDFGLATQPVTSSGFVFEQLDTDEYVLVCRKDDPLARHKSVPWTAIEHRCFVAMGPSSSVRPLTDRTFVEIGISVDVRYESNSISLMGPLVAAGLGVSVLPRLALALTDCSELVVVRLGSPHVTRPVGLLQRAGTPLSPVAERLLTALRQRPGHRGGRRVSKTQ